MADATSAENPSRLTAFKQSLDTRFFLAGLTLFLFVVAATIGGFCISAAAGFYSLAASCLVTTYFLGSSE